MLESEKLSQIQVCEGAKICVKKENEKRSVAVEIFCYFILIHTF